MSQDLVMYFFSFYFLWVIFNSFQLCGLTALIFILTLFDDHSLPNKYHFDCFLIHSIFIILELKQF